VVGMPRPERPVDPEGGVVQRFAVELRDLTQESGEPRLSGAGPVGALLAHIAGAGGQG
jgi:hypothetical protein